MNWLSFYIRKQIKKYNTKGKMLKVKNQTLKELKKDAIELINENITKMRKTIKKKENHQEVMTKIEQVERKTEAPLELAKNNEIIINKSKDYNEF